MRAKHSTLAPVNSGVRDYLLKRLRGIVDRLGALGRLRDPEMVPVWYRCYGLDRIEALERGEAVCVIGYEVAGALSPEDRLRLDSMGHYGLHEDGRLTGPYGGDHAE